MAERLVPEVGTHETDGIQAPIDGLLDVPFKSVKDLIALVVRPFPSHNFHYITVHGSGLLGPINRTLQRLGGIAQLVQLCRCSCDRLRRTEHRFLDPFEDGLRPPITHPFGVQEEPTAPTLGRVPHEQGKVPRLGFPFYSGLGLPRAFRSLSKPPARNDRYHAHHALHPSSQPWVRLHPAERPFHA